MSTPTEEVDDVEADLIDAARGAAEAAPPLPASAVVLLRDARFPAA